MALYTVVIPANARTTLYGSHTMVVEAHSAAAARALAKGAASNDNDMIWDKATVTEVPQNLLGMTFNITIADTTPIVVEYAAVADDTWEEVAAALAALLVAESLTATWTKDTTQGNHGTLLLATGSGTDDLGDKAVTVTATDAAGNDLTAEHFVNVVDEGLATADLTVDMLAGGTGPRVVQVC